MTEVHMMTRASRLFLVSAVGLAILIGGLVAWLLFPPPRNAEMACSAIGGPFTLTATDGTTVSDQTYRGKWMLIYFGYTSCPDACPTALNDMGVALDRLGREASALQPIFITVDPMRDTPDALAEYLKSFDPHIVALTGTKDQIAAVAKAYRVYYSPHEADGGDYLVDHSSYFYLIDPQGAFVNVFAGDLSGDGIAARIEHFMKRTG
jgi:protein SCO1/2